MLRAGRFNELDYEHILEEREDMGREQKVALQLLFRQILIQLLKLELSPAAAPRGKWVDELVEFRGLITQSAVMAVGVVIGVFWRCPLVRRF